MLERRDAGKSAFPLLAAWQCHGIARRAVLSDAQNSRWRCRQPVADYIRAPRYVRAPRIVITQAATSKIPQGQLVDWAWVLPSRYDPTIAPTWPAKAAFQPSGCARHPRPKDFQLPTETPTSTPFRPRLQSRLKSSRMLPIYTPARMLPPKSPSANWSKSFYNIQVPTSPTRNS